MDGLELSELTDDQLVGLAKACCLEAVRRSPAVEAAMQDMMLSEAEKVRVARAATDVEIAASRARERERIAREAAEKVRMEEAARTAASRAAAAEDAAARAADVASQAAAQRMNWLRQLGEALGRSPDSISLLHYVGRDGPRLVVNAGSYRFNRDHLITYSPRTADISTVAAAVKHKPALVQLLARIAALLPINTHISGDMLPWPKS